jgi:hypothetical protein
VPARHAEDANALWHSFFTIGVQERHERRFLGLAAVNPRSFEFRIPDRRCLCNRFS